MRIAEAIYLVCCASRVLAQHAGHTSAAGSTSPRFDFSGAVIYSDHGSFRGDRKLILRDWESFRSAPMVDGRLDLRLMTSVGALFDSEGGPSLLQTGGTYRHGYVHDRQHPHDLVMEAAVRVRLGSVLLYFAPVGSPALGPVPWMHRASASADPVAPIGHHWQDATHVSYGVAGIGYRRGPALLEITTFNARESDHKSPWPDFSHGRLDSFAARVNWAQSTFGASAWWGYLASHDPIAPEMQMHRYGASASVERSGIRGGRWASLAVWGMNAHHHDGSSHLLLHGDPNASPHVRSSSVLLESTLGIGTELALFARAERVLKNGEELGFLGGDLMTLYDIRTMSFGARRDVATLSGARLSLGARGSISVLPSSLELAYGTRRPMGLDFSVQARRAP